MKFSLKQLIFFVTIAALLCGVAGYAYRQGRTAQKAAEAERIKAERALLEFQDVPGAVHQRLQDALFGNQQTNEAANVSK